MKLVPVFQGQVFYFGYSVDKSKIQTMNPTDRPLSVSPKYDMTCTHENDMYSIVVFGGDAEGRGAKGGHHGA